MSNFVYYDEYKAAGSSIVRFRIGAAWAFGKGLERSVSNGDHLFDKLEVMGFRRSVLLNGNFEDTLTKDGFAESPDKGYYSILTARSKDEITYENSNLDSDGLPDYSKLDPNIVSNIVDGAGPSNPQSDDHYLIVGTDFTEPTNENIFSEGTVIKYNDLKYPIVAVNTGGAGTASFEIAGDHRSVFEDGVTFKIVGSTANDGTYTCSDYSTYPASNTVIFVSEAITDGTIDGSIPIFEEETGIGRPLSFFFIDQIGDSTTKNDELIYIIDDILADVDPNSFPSYPSVGLYRCNASGGGFSLEEIVEYTSSGTWQSWTPPTSIDIEAELGPIPISGITALEEIIAVYVRDSNGNIRSNITFTDPPTYNTLDEKLDRLKSTLVDLKFQDITFAVSTGIFLPGDTVWLRYKHYVHTDTLRDRDAGTLFKTKDDVSDTEIIVDFSPDGGALARYPYNNVHFIAHDFNIPMGANNYIIHVGDMNEAGQLRYRQHASGELRNIKAGEMVVIKFNDTEARFLKISLFNPQNKGFIAVTLKILDPELITIGVDDDDTIDVGDYAGISIVPYYHDKSNEESKISSISLGNEIWVGEIVANECGRAYIPQFSNLDDDLKEDYELVYFDIKYFSEVVYSGIIPDKNADLNEVIAVTDDAVSSGAIAIDFKHDVIIERTNGANEYAQTRFKNIIDFPAVTNEEKIYIQGNTDGIPNPNSEDSTLTKIYQPSMDYFQDGRIILAFTRDQYVSSTNSDILAKILTHGNEDSILSDSPGQILVIKSYTGSKQATNPKVKVLANDNFVVVWESNESLSLGVNYSISSSDGVNIGDSVVVPGQSSAADSSDPQVVIFPSGGFAVANKTTGDKIEIAVFDDTEDEVTDPAPTPTVDENEITNVDTTDKFHMISLYNDTFLILYIDTSGNVKVRHYDSNANDIGANEFSSITGTISSAGTETNPSIVSFDTFNVAISYEKPAGTIVFKLYSDVGVELVSTEITLSSILSTDPILLAAPSGGNFIASYQRTDVGEEGFYFKFIEVFVSRKEETDFKLAKSIDPSIDTIYKNGIEIDYVSDFILIEGRTVLQLLSATSINDVLYIIRDEEITIKQDSSIQNLSGSFFQHLGDDYIFGWEDPTPTPDDIYLQSYNQNNFVLIYKNLVTLDETIMVPGEGSLGEYSINKVDGIISFRQDGVLGIFDPGNDGVNFEIKAKYFYQIKRFSEAAPQKYVRFLGAREFPKFIGYSGMRVYPSHYFADYLPNCDYMVDIFPINPDSETRSYQSSGGMVKLLDGSRIRDDYSDAKQDLEYSGPKINDDFRRILKYWADKKELLILVNDMREVVKGFIMPNSLKFTRRKTTEDEQNDESGSYGFSFQFIES